MTRKRASDTENKSSDLFKSNDFDESTLPQVDVTKSKPSPVINKPPVIESLLVKPVVEKVVESKEAEKTLKAEVPIATTKPTPPPPPKDDVFDDFESSLLPSDLPPVKKEEKQTKSATKSIFFKYLYSLISISIVICFFF